MEKKDELIFKVKLLQEAARLVKTEISDIKPENAEKFFEEQIGFYKRLKKKHLQESATRYDITDAMADIYHALEKANC